MRDKRQSTEPVSLNMVPIMNLFLAMIPFLLMCAAFFQVAVINASVPALSEGSEDSEEPKKELEKIILNLQIKEEGFVIQAVGDQPEAELKAIGGTIGKTDQKYDFEKLSERMKAIHDKYKKSDTVIILPQKDVLYEDIVKAMDASRERVIDKRLDKREYMFTKAIVSSLL